jgi:hypothetical protein
VAGIFGVTVFGAAGIVTTISAFKESDGSVAQFTMWALFIAVWSAFTLLSVLICLAYFRQCLILSPTTVIQHGAFGSKTIQVREVIRVEWHHRPECGSIVIRTRTDEIRISLNDFRANECEELSRMVRGTFPKTIQDNGEEATSLP